MKILFIIPARAGSKGLPGKNIKLLNGKPLINYSIEFARKFVPDQYICVSTDGQDIIEALKEIQYEVPFIRPSELATDHSSINDVIKHALNYYKNRFEVETIVLLQPTSPIRLEKHLTEMMKMWNNELDLLVSVRESHDNPYFNLFEENNNGFLFKSKSSEITRRQDAPKVYAFNGNIYIYNVRIFLEEIPSQDLRIKKYIMNEKKYSIDIDTIEDWYLAEYFLDK